MGFVLAESLVLVLWSGDTEAETIERASSALQDAMHVFRPTNLSELYIAVRARVGADAGRNTDLLNALEIASMREPECSLEDFAMRIGRRARRFQRGDD